MYRNFFALLVWHPEWPTLPLISVPHHTVGAQSFATRQSARLTRLPAAAKAVDRTLTLTFIPNTKCGCPILCGPHVRPTYRIDCGRKGWVYKISTPHARPSIRIFLYAQRTAPLVLRWRSPRRQPFLGSVSRRDLFLKIIEEVRVYHPGRARTTLSLPKGGECGWELSRLAGV
jgi:hypothetical protein